MRKRWSRRFPRNKSGKFFAVVIALIVTAALLIVFRVVSLRLVPVPPFLLDSVDVSTDHRLEFWKISATHQFYAWTALIGFLTCLATLFSARLNWQSLKNAKARDDEGNFKEAFELLQNEEVWVRKRGIAVLARTARHSPEMQREIREVLTDFLRAKAKKPELDGALLLVSPPWQKSSFLPEDHQSILDAIGYGEWYSMEDSHKTLNLGGAYLKGADVPCANFSGADFSETDLTSANLSEAKLVRSSLRKACLKEANLSGANCNGADLSETDLTAANLSKTTFVKANLQKADLTGAILASADCRGANFSGARFQWEELRQTNLQGATFQQEDIRNNEINFDEAKRCGANIADSQTVSPKTNTSPTSLLAGHRPFDFSQLNFFWWAFLKRENNGGEKLYWTKRFREELRTAKQIMLILKEKFRGQFNQKDKDDHRYR